MTGYTMTAVTTEGADITILRDYSSADFTEQQLRYLIAELHDEHPNLVPGPMRDTILKVVDGFAKGTITEVRTAPTPCELTDQFVTSLRDLATA